MSEVRMCDKCGTIFSTLSENWQTMSMLDRNNKGAGGSALHVQYDVCAECSVMPPEPKLPTIRATLTAAQIESEYRRTRPLSDTDTTKPGGGNFNFK